MTVAYLCNRQIHQTYLGGVVWPEPSCLSVCHRLHRSQSMLCAVWIIILNCIVWVKWTVIRGCMSSVWVTVLAASVMLMQGDVFTVHDDAETRGWIFVQYLEGVNHLGVESDELDFGAVCFQSVWNKNVTHDADSVLLIIFGLWPVMNRCWLLVSDWDYGT